VAPANGPRATPRVDDERGEARVASAAHRPDQPRRLGWVPQSRRAAPVPTPAPRDAQGRERGPAGRGGGASSRGLPLEQIPTTGRVINPPTHCINLTGEPRFS